MKPPAHNLLSRPALIALVSLVSLLIAVLSIGAHRESPFFTAIDHFFYDQFLKRSTTPELSDRITIIDIDEQSLSAVGQWPWPRYRLAQLIGIVSESSPRAIGLDIIFPEADRTSLKELQRQFRQDFDLELGFSGVPAALTDNDGFLGYVLGTSQTVGARYFYFDHINRESACQYSPFHFIDQTATFTPHQATGVMCNTAAIEDRLLFNGYMNNQHDRDGILRQTPLLIAFQDRLYPHLSLATLMKAEGISDATIEFDRFGPLIKAGTHRIPVTQDGYFRLRFDGPAQRHRYIAAVDLLNGDFEHSDIEDKIVFIGSSAVGLNDLHHTVFDTQFPGIEVHAVIVENVLQQQYIITPHRSLVLIVGVCVATGVILIGLFFLSSGPLMMVLGTIVWILAGLTTSFFAYQKLSLFYSPALPLILSVSLFSIFSVSRFALEKRAAYLWYKKLVDSQQLTLRAMVSMVETRDPETGEHIKRTQHYAKAIADYLKQQGFFPETLTDRFITTLFLSVPLHDIGKVGIPDRILMKQGKLTDEEYAIMKTHADHGRRIIGRAGQEHGIDDYLRMSAEIAGSHHERWDGKGYPDGLAGEQIPLAGRVMAIADVYDALISRRCYKPPFSHQKALDIIGEGNGTQFDPVVTAAFLAIEPVIREIASRFDDSAEKGVIET